MRTTWREARIQEETAITFGYGGGRGELPTAREADAEFAAEPGARPAFGNSANARVRKS